MVAGTTKELISYYEQGFQGAFKDPEAEEELIHDMEYKDFVDVAHANDMVGDGEGKLSLAYECVQRLNPDEYPGKAQRTGCCVSRGTVNAFTASYAYEVWNAVPDGVKNRIIGKEITFYDHIAAGDYGDHLEDWPVVPYPDHQTFDHCTIYGERGHRGQGANCGTLCMAAKNKTGLLPRGKYDIPGFGEYDCSKYDDKKAARSGPKWSNAFREFTNKHHVRDVTGCREIDTARDALANNYGLNVCSGFATSSARPTISDDKGSCAGANRWKGSWAHAMAWLACDDRSWAHDKYGGPLFLIMNSWGDWNRGPRRIYGTDKEIPVGSFWITTKDASRILRGGGAYVLSNIKGFPRRPVFVSFW